MVLSNSIEGSSFPITRSAWSKTSKASMDRNYRTIRPRISTYTRSVVWGGGRL